MNTIPVSAIILTYNEEKNIEECIKSICGWIDDIYIVDSFSTDHTLDIARKYTEKIYQHRFENYAIQRNWAQDNLHIRNEWVFHLDADERATPELCKELGEIFSSAVIDTDGFMVSRRTVFMNRWIKYGGHYPVYHLRIFRKGRGRCEDRLYDQHFYVDGSVRTLKGDIIDTVTSDLGIWITRHRKWAVHEADQVIRTINENVIKGNPKGNPIERKRWQRERYYGYPPFLRAFLYFLYRYFYKFGFLDGREGLVFHVLQGFWYRFLVDVKIYKNEKLKKG